MGAEAHFAGDDRGTKISLGEVVICRNLSIIGPPVHPLLVIVEDLLDTTDSQMLSGSMDRLNDLSFDFRGLFIELDIRDGQRTEVHSRCEKGREDAHERFDLIHFREFSAKVLYFSEQMGIAILKGTGSLVIHVVTIYDQGSWQGFVPPKTSRATVAERVSRNRNRLILTVAKSHT